MNHGLLNQETVLLVASSRIPAGTILILDAGRAGLPLVSAPHGCHFSDRSQYGAKPHSGYDRPEISLVCGLLGGKKTIRPAQNKKPRQSPCPGGQLPKGTDESLPVGMGRRITTLTIEPFSPFYPGGEALGHEASQFPRPWAANWDIRWAEIGHYWRLSGGRMVLVYYQTIEQSDADSEID